MSPLTIRGLPTSLANDAWWMASTTDPQDNTRNPNPRSDGRDLFAPFVIIGLIALIGLADFLFWQQPVGVSLVLFSAGLSAAALASLRPTLTRSGWAMLTSAWVLAALPVVEHLQMVSILFLVFGHAGLLVWCATRSKAGSVLRAVLLLPVTFVIFTYTRCIEFGADVIRTKPSVALGDVTSWVLPLSVGSLFFALIVGANPVFERWMIDLSFVDLDPEIVNRISLWIAFGFFVLPFVMFKTLAPTLHTKSKTRFIKPQSVGMFVNTRSVMNSLILFNLMFLLQNTTDLAILWGGAQLPDGMTYASYVHRGAYPLMATSILAGIFALVSRRFTLGSDTIKLLLVLWVVQNVILLASAIMRLELYVDAYGMTYLRMRAGIGMMLVLVGMVLLIWQLWRAKSNLWLTSSFAAVTVAVFYASSFVNFGYVIAATNLSRMDLPLDEYYLCRQTQSGVKAMQDYNAETGMKLCIYDIAGWQFQSDNWRGWGYRDARLEARLQAYRDAPGKLLPIPGVIEGVSLPILPTGVR